MIVGIKKFLREQPVSAAIYRPVQATESLTKISASPARESHSFSF